MTISSEKFFKKNIESVHLLGLCPILAVTSTAIHALGLGIATTLVMTLTNFFISFFRHWIPKEIRIPIYVIIIASIVSIIQMFINAFFFNLYQRLGIFISLIVSNCIILDRAETFAMKNHPFISAIDGFLRGISITSIMLIMGCLREIIGNGTLFIGMDMLLGDRYKGWNIKLFNTDTCFLLALLPPGGFITFGIILAARNSINQKTK